MIQVRIHQNQTRQPGDLYRNGKNFRLRKPISPVSTGTAGWLIINDIFFRGGGISIGYWFSKRKQKEKHQPFKVAVDSNRKPPKIRFYTVGRAFLLFFGGNCLFLIVKLRGRLTTHHLFFKPGSWLSAAFLYSQLTPANDHQSRTVRERERYKLLKRPASGCSWLISPSFLFQFGARFYFILFI